MPAPHQSHQSASGGIANTALPESDRPDKYLVITPALKIPFLELHYEYTHASGPGGQHVNTTDSAVLLRFNVGSSSAFSPEIRQRLFAVARHKINANGELLITASQSRSQSQNKKKALHNLKEIVLQALRKPKPRKNTAVPAVSKHNRLQAKKNLAEKRKHRQTPRMDE